MKQDSVAQLRQRAEEEADEAPHFAETYRKELFPTLDKTFCACDVEAREFDEEGDVESVDCGPVAMQNLVAPLGSSEKPLSNEPFSLSTPEELEDIVVVKFCSPLFRC